MSVLKSAIFVHGGCGLELVSVAAGMVSVVFASVGMVAVWLVATSVAVFVSGPVLVCAKIN